MKRFSVRKKGMCLCLVLTLLVSMCLFSVAAAEQDFEGDYITYNLTTGEVSAYCLPDKGTVNTGVQTSEGFFLWEILLKMELHQLQSLEEMFGFA